VTGVIEQRVLVFLAMQAADLQVVQPALHVLDHMARLGDGVARISEAWSLACRATAALCRRKHQHTVCRQYAPGLAEDPERSACETASNTLLDAKMKSNSAATQRDRSRMSAKWTSTPGSALRTWSTISCE